MVQLRSLRKKRENKMKQNRIKSMGFKKQIAVTKEMY